MSSALPAELSGRAFKPTPKAESLTRTAPLFYQLHRGASLGSVIFPHSLLIIFKNPVAFKHSDNSVKVSSGLGKISIASIYFFIMSQQIIAYIMSPKREKNLNPSSSKIMHNSQVILANLAPPHFKVKSCLF